MQFRSFDWDSANVEHIARHGLQPNDVEAVCRSRIVILRGRAGGYLFYGQTSAGRYLLIVIRPVGDGRARVITARDMTARERQFYHRRR